MANTDELTRLSAQDLTLRLRERTVSSVEVVQAHLDRIEARNPTLNAFCTLLAEPAMAAAKAADDAIAAGRVLGPLHGLPVALKDLTPTQGVRTTRGSRLFEDDVPEQDAVIVQRIKAAGGIVLGKTNTPEFGHKAITDNAIFGPTRNPVDPERTPGGSSGGSAAAVAAGLAPLAEGSDGAGSIRIPAGLCGLVGFKPTYGRVPDVAGPFSSHTPFFHNGPIARSVADAALLYGVLAGPHGSDPFSHPAEAAVADLEGAVDGLRIAYSPDLGYFEVAEDVRAACAQAAARFEQLGCRVERVDPAFDPEMESAFYALWRMKLAMAYGDLPESDFEKLEDKVRELITAGTALGAVDYGRANRVREHTWHDLGRIHADYDLLICPTTAIPAPKLADGVPATINGKPVDPLIGWFLTYPFNMTGNPSVSVPCGVSAEGLPVGLQIVGRHLADATVLRAARSFERTFG